MTHNNQQLLLDAFQERLPRMRFGKEGADDAKDGVYLVQSPVGFDTDVVFRYQDTTPNPSHAPVACLCIYFLHAMDIIRITLAH